MTDPSDDIRRDGFAVLPGLLDAARTARLREVMDGIRARYLRHNPATRKPGFLSSPWHLPHIDHPAFYEDAPDWWLPEVCDLEAEPRIRELWHDATGDEPTFVYGALFMDPPLPYAVDAYMQKRAAPDGAGTWHRDVFEPTADDVERATILANGRSRDDRNLLEIALVPSDSFEYLPGSHARWDTPLELVARKHGQTLGERTQPLPGGRRIHLEPGDALLVDGRGIHRGWYTHGVTRRTITLVYSGLERLERYPDDVERPRCFLEPEHLARLRPATRAYFQNQLRYSLAWT
ncbi:MAG TPA: hypothetical protein VOB72_01915 [Candidatus Dormibacteraeota bacterium]|nr:hypothetical protein [Candidatus Dormibacteraeota bacterium]